jgi:hypothetical protein
MVEEIETNRMSFKEFGFKQDWWKLRVESLLRKCFGKCYKLKQDMRAYDMMKQAKRKFGKEMDVVRILRQLQKSRLLTTSLLNSH